MADEQTPEVEAEEPTEEVEEAVEAEEEEASVEEPKEESKEESTEEPVIPVRSNASHIIDRKDRQIAKLKAEIADKDVDVEEVDEPGVSERMARIEQRQDAQVDTTELSSFLETEPDAVPYKDRIKAYMEHDAYKQVPPSEIFKIVSFQDAQSKTNSKRKAADLEAGQTKSAGSGNRDTRSKDAKTASDIKNMTNEEFIAYERAQQKLARS